MQERVKVAGLTAILQKVYGVPSWLMSGNLDIGRVLTIHRTDNQLLVPELFVHTMWLILNTPFPSGTLEFCSMPGTGCLCDQPPVKTLSTESLISFPGQQHSHTLSQLNLTLGELMCVLCDSTGREGTWFPLEFTHEPFPLADLAL